MTESFDIKTRLRRLTTWQYFPFVLLAIIMIPFYLFATGRFGDDAYFFANNPLKDGIWSHLAYQYSSWSSRLIILTVHFGLNMLPFALWRILDLAVWLLAGVCVSKLFARGPSANYFIAGCLALYPYWQLATAGWTATTCGYSWPLSFGLFVFLTLKRLYENARLPWYRYALCALAFLYATDAEQMCAIILAVLAFLAASRFFLHARSNPAYTRTIIVLLILTIARLAFTLTTPGNHVRLVSSYHLIPGFESFSLLDKLTLGFDFTVTHYAVCTLGIFPLFSYLLLVLVWRRRKGRLQRCVSAVPLASCAVLSLYAGIRVLLYFRFLLVNGMERGFANAIFDNGLLPGGPIIRLFFLVFFFCVLCSVYFAFSTRAQSLFALGITLLGFGSQMLLGFSPSIYGSGLRTFVFAAFGLIIVSLRMFEELYAPGRFGKGSKALFITAIAANYAVTFAISLFRLGG